MRLLLRGPGVTAAPQVLTAALRPLPWGGAAPGSLSCAMRGHGVASSYHFSPKWPRTAGLSVLPGGLDPVSPRPLGHEYSSAVSVVPVLSSWHADLMAAF